MFCQERELGGLFLDVEWRARAGNGRSRAQGESWLSWGLARWEAVSVGERRELVVGGKTPLAR